MRNYHTKTDLELIHSLNESDERAFEEIYRRYAESLTGFAASKLYSLDGARDVIHDIFARLWEDRNSLVLQGALKAYLFAVVRYRIIDQIRKNVTREEYAAVIRSFEESVMPDAQQLLEGRELMERINRSLDGLSPRVREVYLLSREEQLTISEIASRLNLSEQTVKNQLGTALTHLRRSIPKFLLLFSFLV